MDNGGPGVRGPAAREDHLPRTLGPECATVLAPGPMQFAPMSDKPRKIFFAMVVAIDLLFFLLDYSLIFETTSFILVLQKRT